MMKKIHAVVPIDFFLAPDASSARRIRKFVAKEAPGFNRVIGTWPELMAQAEAAYLLPPGSDDWEENLKQAVSRQNSAFWLSSFKVAPRETIIGQSIMAIFKGKPITKLIGSKNDTHQIPTHRRDSSRQRIRQA